MDGRELAAATMREIERQAAQSRAAEKAQQQQGVKPRQNLSAKSQRRLRIPSFKPASAS